MLVGVSRYIDEYDLFPELAEIAQAPEGLAYVPNFLEEAEELALSEWIDTQSWDTAYSRRRQFYGESYEGDEFSREVPLTLSSLGERIVQGGYLRELPDQVLINEYLPGQGIAAHVDYYPQFGDQVAMVSLLAAYPMRFARGREEFELWLERRSLSVISGSSRYEWTHEIARRMSDPIPGAGRRSRGRRISITFRKRMPGSAT